MPHTIFLGDGACAVNIKRNLLVKSKIDGLDAFERAKQALETQGNAIGANHIDDIQALPISDPYVSRIQFTCKYYFIPAHLL